MNITELKSILQNMTPGDWEVWTSNSFRRITAAGQPDGGVLSGTIQRHDNHPDLEGINRDADLKGICALKNTAHSLIEIAEAAVTWWYACCTCGCHYHLSTCSRQIALERFAKALCDVNV